MDAGGGLLRIGKMDFIRREQGGAQGRGVADGGQGFAVANGDGGLDGAEVGGRARDDVAVLRQSVDQGAGQDDEIGWFSGE